MHTTIWPNYKVLFHLFFLQCMTLRPKTRIHIDLFFYFQTTIRPNYRVLFHLFFSFFSARPFEQNVAPSLIHFFHLHTTIRQKHMIFFLSFILSLCMTIRPKNRVLINLFFLFVHDHSTKLGVTLTVSFNIFLDVPIFRLLYSWTILPLYFHCSLSGSAAFVFCPLYS